MPPRKKIKETHAPERSGGRKLRGRRGSLAEMPHVPLDVIIEILGYLHPRDILNLARTSKDFRALLLNPQHAFIWKTARKALPGRFPDPHPFLSEPALAHLMFSGYCHHCGKNRVYKVFWLWLKRYCSECLPLMTLAPRAVEKRMNAIGLGRVQDSDFREIFSYISREKARWTTWEDVSNRFHVTQVQRFEQEWRDADDHPGSLARLYQDRKEHVEGEFKLAVRLQRWAKKDRLRRAAEVDQAREELYADMRRRLKQAGWGIEVKYYTFSVDHHLLNARGSRVHTLGVASNADRGHVYRFLEAHMITLRSQRLGTLWENVFDAIHIATTLHYPLKPHAHADGLHCTADHGPSALDIAWMPESEELFVDAGVANARALRTYVNTVVAPRVPQLVALWEERVKAQLRGLVLAVLSPTHVPTDIDPLDLAVAVFGCAYCETTPDAPAQESTALLESPLALRFPEILAHKCFHEYDRWHTTSSPLPFTQAYQQHIFRREREFEKQTWCRPVATSTMLPDRISMSGARRACATLLGARCDPGRITLQEMRKWDSREGMWIPPAHIVARCEPGIAALVWNDGRTTGAGAQSTDGDL